MKRQWFVVAVLVVVVALALAVPSFAAPKPPSAPKGQDYYAGLVTLRSDVLSQNGFTGYTVSHGVGVAGLYEVVFPADTFTYGTESVVLLAWRNHWNRTSMGNRFFQFAHRVSSISTGRQAFRCIGSAGMARRLCPLNPGLGIST